MLRRVACATQLADRRLDLDRPGVAHTLSHPRQQLIELGVPRYLGAELQGNEHERALDDRVQCDDRRAAAVLASQARAIGHGLEREPQREELLELVRRQIHGRSLTRATGSPGSLRGQEGSRGVSDGHWLKVLSLTASDALRAPGRYWTLQEEARSFMTPRPLAFA